MIKRFCLLLAFSIAPLHTVSAASLTTTYDCCLGQEGNMFDVLVADNDLYVTGFDVNLGYGNYDLALYSIDGTWQGSENTAANWSLLSTTTVSSTGPGVATYADFDDFWLSANSSTGLYITLTNNLDTGVMYYSNGSAVGNLWAANSDLQLLEGIGIEYAFGTTYSPRGWNGTVYYDVAPSAVPVPAAMWLFVSGLVGLAGVARRQHKSR
jgi:hypothetical protein